MNKIFITILQTGFVLYLSISLSSCVMPYLQTTSMSEIDKQDLSSHTFFYKGTLENPEIILGDKQGGLKNSEKSWKTAGFENVKILLLKAKYYEAKELIVKNGDIISSEGFLLTPKSVEDEFYYTFSTNIKKGYFIIKKQNKRPVGVFASGWRWSRFKK